MPPRRAPERPRHGFNPPGYGYTLRGAHDAITNLRHLGTKNGAAAPPHDESAPRQRHTPARDEQIAPRHVDTAGRFDHAPPRHDETPSGYSQTPAGHGYTVVVP